MASIDVKVHPDPKRITVRYSPGRTVHTLDLRDENAKVAIFVNSRAVLDALEAALTEIALEMSAQDASDQVPSEMADWPVGELVEVYGK